MSAARLVVALAVLGVGAYAVAAYARQAGEGGELAAVASPTLSNPASWAGYGDDIQDAIYDLGSEVGFFEGIAQSMQSLDVNTNARAFLEAIKRCEGTAGQADPYRVCYGYSWVVRDLSEHPAVSGEWRGKTLTDEQCSGAGYGPGCVSTAAGAYQMTRPTWIKLRDRLGLGDFGPASQDAAAIELLRECGALDRLGRGDLAGAVSRARRIWASLPGANYAGQGMRSMADVTAWYQGAGGAVA